MHTPFERTVEPAARATERRFGAPAPRCAAMGCFMCLWTACSRKQRDCRDPETVRIACLHASAMGSAASLVSAA